MEERFREATVKEPRPHQLKTVQDLVAALSVQQGRKNYLIQVGSSRLHSARLILHHTHAQTSLLLGAAFDWVW